MNNRISTPDLRVGDHVWMFYTFAHTKAERAEGIFEGEIVSFLGNSLNIAKIYNIALDIFININIRQLNRVE